MAKGVKSASLSSRSKRKGSALGRRLVAGLSEALAHARGEIELPSYTVTVHLIVIAIHRNREVVC